MADSLLTPKEAAASLRVSVSYLRNSDCPKILLPSGRGARPVVRYRRADIDAWVTQWEAKAAHPQRRVRIA